MKTIIFVCIGLGIVVAVAYVLYIEFIQQKRKAKEDALGLLIVIVITVFLGALGGAILGLILYHPLIVQTTWKSVTLLPFFEIYVFAIIYGIVNGREYDRSKSLWIVWLSEFLTILMFTLVLATIINAFWTKNSFWGGVILPLFLITLSASLLPGLFFRLRSKVEWYVIAQGGWTRREIPLWYYGLYRVPGLSYILGWSMIFFVASGSYTVLTRLITLDDNYERIFLFNQSVFAISTRLMMLLLVLSFTIIFIRTFQLFLKEKKRKPGGKRHS